MTRPNSTTQSIVTPPYPRPMNRNMRLARHQPEVEPPVRRQRLLYIPGMLSQIRLAVTDLEAEACRRGEWSSLNYNQATAAALHITRDMLRFIVLPGESLFEQTLERRPQNQLAISLKRPNVTDSDWHVRPWKHYGILVRPVRSLTGIHLDSSYFAPSDDLLVAIVLMLDGAPPTIFLIPSTKWLEIRTCPTRPVLVLT